MFRARAAIVLLATVSCGCAALVTAHRDAREGNDYFPLHPGTLWVYEVRDSLGGVALERVLVRGLVHLGTQDADGYVVEESGGLAGEFALDVEWHPVVYYRHDRFLYKFSGVDYVEGQLRELRLGEGEEKVLPDDPAEHLEWHSDFDIFRPDPGSRYRATTTSTAIRVRQELRVRAGTFASCLGVESKSQLESNEPHDRARLLGFRYLDWYAPGVGLVRSEVRSLEDGRLLTTLELVSFRDGRRRE